MKRPNHTIDNNENTQGQTGQQMNQNPYYPAKKSNKKTILGVISVIVLLIASGFIYMHFMGPEEETSFMENINQSQDANNITEGSEFGAGLNDSGTESQQVSDATIIKWPSDISPKEIDFKLSPVTGDPVFYLRGEKQGVGDVIRTYDKTGKLTGFWVIAQDPTPAFPNVGNGNASQTNNTNNENITDNQPQEDGQNKMTPEQEVATLVHEVVKGEETINKSLIIEKYADEMKEIADNYNTTPETIVNVYLQELQKLQETQNQD